MFPALLAALGAWFWTRREVGGVAARALRSLLPSWRFFDTIAPVPTLEARSCGQPGTGCGPWERLLAAPPTRAPLRLLHNPFENLRLAHYALLERLVDDLAELEAGDDERVVALVSYQLVLRLVRSELQGRGAPPYFQFRLMLAREAPDRGSETLLLSRVHAA